MSRGLGIQQRRILDALVQRADQDAFQARGEAATLTTGEDWQFGPVPVLRARWRWYTIDLLDLVDANSSRSTRASLHRAVWSLHRDRRVQAVGQFPYPQPFSAHINHVDQLVGGVDLFELSRVDPRWPSRTGRALWFRLPAPDHEAIPEDDQLAVLHFIDEWRPDPFEDFVATLDRQRRWSTATGQCLKWLFCGHSPAAEPVSTTLIA